ncbi:MAG: ABC transporter ATP-binding protein [Nitrospirae bacterium]|nr:ABC transporter ATP-binding protein [Magnetococcales bacterium]
MTTHTVVLAEGLEKSYDRHRVIDGVSLTLPQGVCLALLGHNGAGKTTLMKMMLGVTRPTAGRLELFGCTPATAGMAFRRRLGFLPENVAFYDEMTGLDTLTYLARLKGVNVARCREWLAQVGLTEAASRRVKTYSKGMRQRLGLAQALLGRPGLLLLDEPTTGMDPMVRQEFFQIIREVCASGGTVILSSHILTELEAHTDLIAILCQGRLTAFGSLETLRHQVNAPVRLRLSVADNPMNLLSQLGDPTSTRVDEQTVDIFCSTQDKMTLLRRITQIESVRDIEIHPPTLEVVYAHLSNPGREPTCTP